MTPAGLAALRTEVEELETTGRYEIAARIKTAREWGDLKENAEYHDAKNSQALLERRITMLRSKLDSARAVEASEGTEVVGFGSEVHVEDAESGRKASYTLVGSTEANVGAGRLSVDSPIAQALMGAKVGQEVRVATPRGVRKLRVERIGG